MKSQLILLVGVVGSLLPGCSSSEDSSSSAPPQVPAKPPMTQPVTVAAQPTQASAAPTPAVTLAPTAIPDVVQTMPPPVGIPHPTVAGQAGTSGNGGGTTVADADANDSPTAYVDAFADAINSAQSSADLDAIDVRIFRAKARFRQMANTATAPNQLVSSVNWPMHGAMEQLHAAVSRKRIELSGQRTFETSDQAIYLARSLAEQSERAIENAKNPALAEQRRQEGQRQMSEGLVNAWKPSGRG